MPTKERNPTFDVIKALMMLWVIWGHLVLYKVVSPTASVYMQNAKIGVNMPVFFVIGGLLAASTFSNAGWSKLIVKTGLFIWPQFVVATLYGVVAWFAGGGGAFSWVMGMWFLRTYAIVYLLVAIVYRVVGRNDLRWILFLVLYAAMLFRPEHFRVSWFDQVVHMFPYFVFGLMCLQKKEWYHDWRIGCSCGVLFLASVFFQGDSSVNGMNFWMVNAHWKELLSSWHGCFGFVARTTVGITGSIFLLFLINVLITAVPGLARVSVLGTTSLGVYVMHEYPLCWVGRQCSIVPLPSWTHWVVAIFYFLLCHCLVMALKKFSASRNVVFGNEIALINVMQRVLSLQKPK